eukprot:TRINITY_DN14444_c0_g3_i1.p1 TRINITY_DN14444_c0_g3~~TRINITY_DN14444_c0_g3_i1.p1  ORF type:complete len:147 (-),score=34.94 TRINITY_DN14444_c0_g3_i1:311-751(-)
MKDNPYDNVSNALLTECAKLSKLKGSKRSNSRNKKCKTSTKQLLLNKENFEGSSNIKSFFNLSDHGLNDKFSSSAENQVRTSHKNSQSPWEGNNPLMWCRSIDSVVSRMESLREAQSRNKCAAGEGTFARYAPVCVASYCRLHCCS